MYIFTYVSNNKRTAEAFLKATMGTRALAIDKFYSVMYNKSIHREAEVLEVYS